MCLIKEPVFDSSSGSLPEQQAAITQLFISGRCKIWSLCKAQKAGKRFWLVNGVKNEFYVNPFNEGKTLLISSATTS